MISSNRPRPLAHFVAMLLACALVPSVLLGAAVVSRVGQLDQVRADAQALQLARATSNDIDREIDGNIESLIALSTSAALKQGDYAAFYEQAVQTLAHRKLHVFLSGLDGQQIINTRLPLGSPLPKNALSATDQDVITTRRPATSNLVLGAVTKTWVIGVSVPIISGDKVQYILTMSIEPRHLQTALVQSVPGEGWIVALSDRAGHLIARSSEHESFVGREMPPEVRELSIGSDGVHRVVNLSGGEVVRGYARSQKSGWLTAAFISSTVVDQPLNALWRLLTLLTLALLAISIPVVALLTRQVSQPIADAVSSARALGRGDLVSLVPSPMTEANELSAALAQASEELKARERALSETETRHRSVFEQSAVGFEQVSPDGKLLGINDLLCKLLGYTRDECLAKSFRTLTHPDDWEAESKLVDAVLTGKAPHYEFEKRLIKKSGEAIWVRVTSAAVRDPAGKVLYRTSVVEDVSERRKAREGAARLAAIVQASPDALFSTCLSGTIETWNPGGSSLFGYSKEEIVGQSLMVLATRTKPNEFEKNLEAILRGEVLRLDAKWRHKDGTMIDVAVSAAPIRTKGIVSSISLTVEDIRDRKRREAQILLLNRELAHRVKNTLAVIQSISNQTLRSTPEPKVFRLAFQGRLQALSAANDLLMQTSWDGAEIKDFIDRQLAPLMPKGSAQLSKDGPAVTIPAELTTHLGLALHELGTNALKYGAWSRPAGHVLVTWDVSHTSDDATARLQLIWTETGGPQIKSPDRSGFGTTLIEKGIPDSIVERRFLPGGLVCKIDVALPVSHPIYLG